MKNRALSIVVNFFYFIVDYKLRDWDKGRDDFEVYMKEKYPNNKIELTVKTEFV